MFIQSVEINLRGFQSSPLLMIFFGKLGKLIFNPDFFWFNHHCWCLSMILRILRWTFHIFPSFLPKKRIPFPFHRDRMDWSRAWRRISKSIQRKRLRDGRHPIDSQPIVTPAGKRGFFGFQKMGFNDSIETHFAIFWMICLYVTGFQELLFWRGGYLRLYCYIW